jgi:beta-lactam-binding protein with PASTA domain/actin-like ATPase involved in cell morphogenesis
MVSAAFGLGVDFGTSSTVAMLRWPDGRVKPLLFEGSPLLPSAVFAPQDGPLVVGSDALHHGRFEPSQLEPNPKRLIDDEGLLLGSREVSVLELFTAVLKHVAAETARVTGGVLPATALAYPAGWGTVRRGALLDAAQAAGLGSVTLVPEPVAAADYFTRVLNRDVPLGQALVVYDLGAGTFDSSAVRRVESGFEVAAVDGLNDIGGLDLDAAIVKWLREGPASGVGEKWTRIENPSAPEDRRQRRELWDDVRIAKEMLSRAPAVLLRLPALDLEVQFTREEFEAAAQPLLTRTVRTTAALMRYAGLSQENIAGLLLVGGASRVPLVATLLHRTLNIAPVATEQPELIVAEGALQSVTPTVAPEGHPVSGIPGSPMSGIPGAPVSAQPMGQPVSAQPYSAAPAGPVSGVPGQFSGAPMPGFAGAPGQPVSGGPGQPAYGPPLGGPVSAPPMGAPGQYPVSAPPVSGAPGQVSGPPAHVSGAPAHATYTPPHGYGQPQGYAQPTTPPHGYAPPVSGAGAAMPVSGGPVPVSGSAGVGFAHPATPPGHWAAVPTAPHHTLSNQGQSATGTVYTGGSVPAVEPMHPPLDNRASRVIPVWDVASSPRHPVATNQAAPVAAAPPTTQRRSPIKVIVAGVVAVWIIVAAVVILMNLPGGGSDTKVPNLAGQTQDDAATQLKAASLAVGNITYEDSTSVPANMIIRTEPAADKKVDPGTKVTLVLARTPGADQVTLPDVANKTQDDATAALTTVGLAAGEVVYEQSDTVGENLVIRTEPAANTQVPAGSPVKLVLAQKPGQTQQAQPPCHVPDLAHQPREYAEQQLKNAGIQYQIKKEDSDSVQPGTVIRTDPGPGPLEHCRRVTVVVSQGLPIPVPDVIGDPEGYAKQQIIDVHLKASVKYDNYCGPAENQDAVVKSQNPHGGSTAHDGDTVTITIPKYTGTCASSKTTNDQATT